MGKVPKQPPKYISAFFEFLTTLCQGDQKEIGKILKYERVVCSWMTRHWAAFQEEAARQAPPKKPRTDQPYNESKLSKDAKTIVTKLETMDEHLTELNIDDIHEHIEAIYLFSKDMYRKIQDNVQHEDNKEEESMIASASLPLQNTDTQTATTTEPSMPVVPPPPVPMSSSSVVVAPVVSS